MEQPANNQPFAWQPITFGGIARFAHAPRGRLLLVQLLCALLAAAAVLWVLQRTWVPVVAAAIKELPAQGEIRGRKLSWLGPDPARLADNRFLAIAVDLRHSTAVRSPSHVQVELGLSNLEVLSLFGYTSLPYPARTVPLNRVFLEPWWGAWSPAILALLGLLIVASLMLIWALLATLYCLPAWLLGFFANRDLSLRSCWNLAGAALMPGALIMCGTVLLYGLGFIELIGLMVGTGLHLLAGWVFLAVSTFKVRWLPGMLPSRSNPFTGPRPVA